MTTRSQSETDQERGEVIPLEPLKAWLEERIALKRIEADHPQATGREFAYFRGQARALSSVFAYLDSKGEPHA